MRLRTRSALASFPLVLALALTGCGSEEKDGGVATVNGGAQKGGGDGGTSGMSPHDMAVKFAECMRKNGVPMDDPQPGQGIRMKVDKGKKEAMDKAMEACRQYNPQANADPEQKAAAEERGRAFAACMRKNGVEKFPDPAPGQQGIRITPEIGKDPDLETAQRKCQDTLGGPGGPAKTGGDRK
ncbi:hypothetical protein GCM10023085_14800 [Actinomadura viridis]|uniref:Uncharacterized protein n=1 Tax=Actinomadura viridis TaxID=58110 RepID=A0A931DPS9_9ACTN|nr:hypothetical protein [Actinomadura viridis]MBG6093850.1 hypothetical protein [Actinomadura viridis]